MADPKSPAFPQPGRFPLERARLGRRLPERWLHYGVTAVGQEACLDHCPACLAWRTCFISPDRTVRCYACGADDIEVDVKVLQALGLK